MSGLILAYGAIGEYLEEHGRLPHWMHWSNRPKLVFVWMVALSLVGEFLGDAGVFVFSRHLQSISDIEVAALSKQAGQANERAAIAEGVAKGYDSKIAAANERAAKAERDVSESKARVAEAEAGMKASMAKIASADARIAEAHSDAAKARADAARFNEIAERERLARIKLEESQKWRILSAQQLQAITHASLPYAGQAFSMNAYSDPESMQLANAIFSALVAAKWEAVKPQIGMIALNDPARSVDFGQSYESGVAVFMGPDNMEALPAATELANALTLAGVNCAKHRTEQLKGKTPKAIMIDIGQKPPQ